MSSPSTPFQLGAPLCFWKYCTCVWWLVCIAMLACMLVHICLQIYIRVCVHACMCVCVCLLFRPGFGSCTGACKVTSCKDCYYNEAPREIPSGCQQQCDGLTERPLQKCLRKWGRCIRKQYKMLYARDQVRNIYSYNASCIIIIYVHILYNIIQYCRLSKQSTECVSITSNHYKVPNL